MKTVLITDDEPALLELYHTEFRQAGYAVMTAPNAPAALKVLETQPIDCIVMDIRMPENDGLEAISEIRRSQHGIPIVLNTAYESYKNDFHSWLADAYVVKSPDVTKLIDTVDRVLGGRGDESATTR